MSSMVRRERNGTPSYLYLSIINLMQFRLCLVWLERKEMITPSHSERLIPPKFTLPITLSKKQHGIDANTAATATPSSGYIALPELQIRDSIVLGMQITGIVFFAISAWIGIFFIHALFTYTVFLSVVTAIIASILASLAFRRAYMQRVKQETRLYLSTQTLPTLRKDTWGHLRVVTVDTLTHLVAIGRNRH
jgi:hypothetical protein